MKSTFFALSPSCQSSVIAKLSNAYLTVGSMSRGRAPAALPSSAMADDAPRRKQGRPPLDGSDSSVRFSVRLTPRAYDALYARAAAARMSLADYARERLRGGARPATTGHAPRGQTPVSRDG